VSVASGSGRKMGGFSLGAHCLGPGLIGSLGYGAGRGWLGGGSTVPCTVVHGTGLVGVRVHGNAGRGLGELGSIVTSEWHVHYVA
jgi:hypothetical protein